MAEDLLSHAQPGKLCYPGLITDLDSFGLNRLFVLGGPLYAVMEPYLGDCSLNRWDKHIAFTSKGF
jgi:hypothetical protein